MFDFLPPKKGLYDPNFEKDSCGVGAVIDKEGNYTHKTGTYIFFFFSLFHSLSFPLIFIFYLFLLSFYFPFSHFWWNVVV